MAEPLLAPSFLFRFSIPCGYHADAGVGKKLDLDAKYVVPSFGELEDRKLFAELRAAWSEQGLTFQVRVTGKKKSLWCRAASADESDGLHVWIDTRNTQSIHRAGRFCHRFVFMPSGGGRRRDEPMAIWLPINRAREQPKAIPARSIKLQHDERIDGYLLYAHLQADALTGFDIEQQPQLGFSYAIVDRELGWQTFSVGPEFPFDEDPSLWGTLELSGGK